MAEASIQRESRSENAIVESEGRFRKKNDEIERGSVYSRLERDMDKKMISYETNVERVKSMNI